jgi:hypothetical protein
LNHKTIFEVFDCDKPEKLSREFIAFQIGEQLKSGGKPVPGTLAAANGIEIISTIEYGDAQVASDLIEMRAQPGGCALALRVSRGPGVDPRTGERRKVWPVGAKVANPDPRGTRAARAR